MSSEACPRTLRYICACLQRDVQNRCKRVLIFSWSISFRWPQERFVKTRVVSGFIFLRLLCPAILNPRQVFYLVVPSKAWCSTTLTFLQFGLLSEPVPPPAMRSLVMIAKCLQVKFQAISKKQLHSTSLESCQSGGVWRKGTLHGGVIKSYYLKRKC